MYSKENQEKYFKVIIHAWNDPAFKKKLMQNPEETLKEAGINVGNASWEVHENSPNKKHFVIPEKPPGEINEESLKASGGLQTAGFSCERCMS